MALTVAFSPDGSIVAGLDRAAPVDQIGGPTDKTSGEGHRSAPFLVVGERGFGRRRLGDSDARALLASAISGALDERVGDRIVAETRGNPVALMELPGLVMLAAAAEDDRPHLMASLNGI
jgi:hypothetical protein